MPLRPPFTGIHETSTDSGGGAPDEGGGPLPPYGEDLFQRIVDVNWTGGRGGDVIFVSGDVCCYIRAARASGLDQQWFGIGCLEFGDGGGHTSCSYGRVHGNTPVFLVVGNNDGSGMLDRGSLAMGSNNGLDWFVSLHMPGGPGFSGVCWDRAQRRFYIETWSDECWSSGDGRAWDREPNNSFAFHCIDGIPDGIIGRDHATGQVIHPNEVFFPGFYCRCTAFMSGIWMAGGSGSGGSTTLASIDGGANWVVVTEGALNFAFDDPIVCIIGAPISHFKGF